MHYPDRLIPHTSFKLIQADLSGYLLCRVVSAKSLLEKVNDLFLKEVLCENDKELFDYSTNLLGCFLPNDNQIILIGDDKKYFYAYWDFIEDVSRPVYQRDFEIDSNRTFFLLPIGDIHRKISIPCPSPPKKSDDVLIAHVIHSPTRSNFWHFSIRWMDKSGQEDKYKSASWQKRMSSTMRHSLQQLIRLDLPDDIVPIHHSHYVQDEHQSDFVAM